jgi:hypothetical protein
MPDLKLVLACAALSAPAYASPQEPRELLPPGQTTNAVEKPATDGVGASFAVADATTQTAAALVQLLLGPGVTATNVVLTGTPAAAGSFTGGLGSVGLIDGVVLSSGHVASVLGPNALDYTSTDNLRPGDAALNALTTSATHDACVLEFDFTVANSDQISFQYVFSSEEYNEWVNTSYNDVFGFFLNGQNIALLPSGASVAINNVNCGNPYNAGAGGNCGLYVNNRCVDLPGGSFPCAGAVDTEMDGMTVVLTASGTLQPGVNHIRLAIADAGDSIYDSNVFIRGGSFTPGVPGPYFPEAPCDEVLHASVGLPITFEFGAQSASGSPANSVTLEVDNAPFGMTHSPALPLTVYGQNVVAATTATWIPNGGQIGFHQIDYLAIDQDDEEEECQVNVVVSDTFMVFGFQQISGVIPGTNGRVLLVEPLIVVRVSPQVVPQWFVPNDPALYGFNVYAQIGMYNPTQYPAEPFRLSEGLEATLGVGFDHYGSGDGEIDFSFDAPPLLGAMTQLSLAID